MATALSTQADGKPPARLSSRGLPGVVVALSMWLLAVGGLALLDGLIALSRTLILVAASMTLLALGLICAILLARPASLRRSLARLQLGPWVCVSFAIIFGAATLIWLSPAEGTRRVIDQAYLVPACLLAAVGLLCFVAGYRCTPRLIRSAADRIDTALRGDPPRSFGVGGVLALWTTSMLAQALAIGLGSFGYLADPTAALATTSSLPAALALLSNLGLFATMLAAWRAAAVRTLAAHLVLVGVTASQLGLGLFSGMKEEVIIQFVAVFIGYGVRRRVRFVSVLIVAALVVVVVVPFVTQYRTTVLAGSGRLSAAEVLATVDFNDVAASSGDTSVGDSFEQLLARLSRIGDVAVVMQKTPTFVPFNSPSDLIGGPLLGLIPRSVWPGKPVLDAGYRMTSTYYGLPKDVYSSSAMTPYGDLWRHGGFWVVAMGMLVIGGLARSVDARSGDPAQDPRILFLPLLLFAPLAKQEMDYLGLMASLVGFVIVANLAARLVSLVGGPSPGVGQDRISRPAHAERGDEVEG